MKIILQLIITAQSPHGTMALIKSIQTPFPIPVECIPTGNRDRLREDVHDTIDRELGTRVSLTILNHCKNTPLFRKHTRGRTDIFAFKAHLPSEDIGIAPEKASQFIWATADVIRALPKIEESDRETLLLALS